MVETSDSTMNVFCKVRCKDDVEILIPLNVLNYFELLKAYQESYGGNEVIPLDFESRYLEKLIEYYSTRSKIWETNRGNEVSDEDKALFFERGDYCELTKIILVADYLNAEAVFDLTCKIYGTTLKDKSVGDLRKIFNIRNDWSTEKYKQLQEENIWCLDESPDELK